MYTEAGAARLLRVAPATLHYWLEGRPRGTKTYKPVIRTEPTGSNRVTKLPVSSLIAPGWPAGPPRRRCALP